MLFTWCILETQVKSLPPLSSEGSEKRITEQRMLELSPERSPLPSNCHWRGPPTHSSVPLPHSQFTLLLQSGMIKGTVFIEFCIEDGKDANVNFENLNTFSCLGGDDNFLNTFDFIVVQVEFSAFSSHPSLPPQISPPPSPVSIPPLVIVHVSFIVVPVNPSHFPPIIPSPLPSGYCQIVLNFNDWLYLACLFVLLIRFLLRVSSYGICPSPPGLFHLA